MRHSSLSPPTPSRRSLLRGVAGVGALSAVTGLSTLTGCAAPRAIGADGTRLRYWHLFGGGDGVNMAAMLDAFSAAHPDIALEASTLQWGAPYYTKLGMAGAGGRAPEVAALHLARLPGFAPGRLLDPFDLDLLADHGVTAEQVPAHLWERGTVDGQQYAIPMDTHPVVLYFNTEVCREAGLLDARGGLRPIRGVAAFTEALRAAKRVTGEPGLVTETLGADTIGPWRIFATFYPQTGGTLLSEDATRITLDDTRALKVLEWMRSLTEEGLAVRQVDYNGSISVFSNGQTGFLLNGEWEVSTLLTAGLDFSMLPVPNLFGRAATQADCHALVLPHQSDRGGKSNEAAHAFVAWMLQNTVEWAKGGHIPAYLPTLEKPEYLELDPQSQYRGAIEDVVLDPPAWFAGSASVMWLELGAVLSGVFTGSRSPKSALAELKARLQDLLDTENPFGAA